MAPAGATVVEPSSGFVAAAMEVDSACPGRVRLPATSRFEAGNIDIQETKEKKDVATLRPLSKLRLCAKLVHVRTMSEVRLRSRRKMERFLGWSIRKVLGKWL